MGEQVAARSPVKREHALQAGGRVRISPSPLDEHTDDHRPVCREDKGVWMTESWSVTKAVGYRPQSVP